MAERNKDNCDPSPDVIVPSLSAAGENFFTCCASYITYKPALSFQQNKDLAEAVRQHSLAFKGTLM